MQVTNNNSTTERPVAGTISMRIPTAISMLCKRLRRTGKEWRGLQNLCSFRYHSLLEGSGHHSRMCIIMLQGRLQYAKIAIERRIFPALKWGTLMFTINNIDRRLIQTMIKNQRRDLPTTTPSIDWQPRPPVPRPQRPLPPQSSAEKQEATSWEKPRPTATPPPSRRKFSTQLSLRITESARRRAAASALQTSKTFKKWSERWSTRACPSLNKLVK